MNPSAPTIADARIETLLRPLAGTATPGVVVGVLQRGQVLHSAGYGLACLAQQQPLGPQSLLRIASVSKQFTVAAALLLEQRGLLKQSDDVRQHLPELAELPSPVRLGHLMRNSSGLPDLLELLRLGGVQLDQRITRAQLLAVMARNRHLNFSPGSRFLYCNSGFALLGLVVERLSGQSLGDFLQQQLFQPLGMRQTRMLVESDLPLPGLASPHIPDGQGGWRRAQHGFEHGGEGGLVSSVGDLLIWAGQLMAPGPGLAPLVAALGEAQTLSGGAPSPYALGLEHGRLDGTIATLGHGGLWPGFRTEFLTLPAEQLAVVVISNDGGHNPYKTARQIARLLLGRPAASADAGAAQALSGRWADAGSGQLLELSLSDDGRLMAQQWGVGFELEAQPDGGWRPLRGAYELQLLGLDAQGRLQIATGAGQQQALQRLDQRPPLPRDMASAVAGRYWSADAAALWEIRQDAAADAWQLWAEGPLHRNDQPWPLQGLGEDWLELQAPAYWMSNSLLLRLERDGTGRVQALRVDASRIKGLRFERQA